MQLLRRFLIETLPERENAAIAKAAHATDQPENRNVAVFSFIASDRAMCR
jgi:hypothetical protein